MRTAVQRVLRHSVTAWRRPAAAALAGVAAFGCFAITAGGRAQLAARTQALHTEIADAPPTESTVTATADWPTFATRSQATIAAISRATARVHDALAADLPLVSAPAASWAAFETPERSMTSWPSAASPGAIPVRLRLVYRDDYALHTRLLSGRRPGAQTPDPDTQAQSTDASAPTSATPIEADLTAATAARLGARIGSLLTLESADGRGLTAVRVVGLVAPTGPTSAFWGSDAALATPQLENPQSSPYWGAAALIGPAQVDALLSDQSAADFRLWWGFTLATDRVDADGAAALADRLDSMTGVADTLDYGADLSVPVSFYSPLTPRLRAFTREQRTASLETAMPETSLALIAAFAAALLAYAVTDRRRAEAWLQRARGAPVRFVVFESLRDGCLTALPASALGALAGFAVPGLTPADVFQPLLAVALAATSAPALCALALHRPRRVKAGIAPPSARSRGRTVFGRRAIAQGAVAVACLAGIDLARTQGIGSSGGVNRYAAAAPVLMSALAALVVVNALPSALRTLRRRAAARPGIVGLFGVARAARRPAGAQAAAFVLSIAACTADLSMVLARAPHSARPDPLMSATQAALNLLAVATVAAGCAVAGLAGWVGAPQRSADSLRLAAMGLSTRQAAGIALVESAPLVLVSTLIGAFATLPLLWAVRPALGPALPAGVSAIAPAALAIALPAVALVALPPAVAGSIGRGAAGADGVRLLEGGQAR